MESGEFFPNSTAPFDLAGHSPGLAQSVAGPSGLRRQTSPAPALDDLDDAATSQWDSGKLKRVAAQLAQEKAAAAPAPEVDLDDSSGFAAPGPTTIGRAPRRPAPKAVVNTRSPIFLGAVMVAGVLLGTSFFVCVIGAFIMNLEERPVSAPAVVVSETGSGQASGEVAPKSTGITAVSAPQVSQFEVVFSTEPPGAIVKEFDALIGRTPHVVKFADKDSESRRLQVELDGHKSTYVDISPQDAPGLTIMLQRGKAGPAAKRQPRVMVAPSPAKRAAQSQPPKAAARKDGKAASRDGKAASRDGKAARKDGKAAKAPAPAAKAPAPKVKAPKPVMDKW